MALGESALSAHESFLRDGYNDRLYKGFSVEDEKRTVLVLGGYLGDSVQEWISRFNYKVEVVEPIHDFAEALNQRFQNEDDVHIHEIAVSNFDGNLRLHGSDDATGAFTANLGDTDVNLVKCIKFSTFLGSLSRTPKIVEMNIEGGEYQVLEDAIQSGVIREIKTLIVQFHNIGNSSEFDRAKLRQSLSNTHECTFNYEWIWERWDSKPPADPLVAND